MRMDGSILISIQINGTDTGVDFGPSADEDDGFELE